MSGTIKDDATYQKMMPLLKQTAQRYGIPADELASFFGDKYDPDTIEAYRYGGFDVDKQENLEATREYRGMMDENQDQRTAIQQSRAAAANAAAAARVGQGERRTNAYVKNTENQIERRNNPVARPSSSGGTPRPAGVQNPLAKHEGKVVVQGGKKFLIKGGKAIPQ
jgi:hypothetical protein